MVLSFSFTNKELRADPWATLRESLEQLDIKYSSEYEQTTTHVVSKKRNTSKGLQALINGKYIVTDSFINAIVEAATPPVDIGEGAKSPLEEDFFGKWPNALDHLPPRGEEPSNRPPGSYAPDQRRQEVFDGYTFVFYEKKQYDNLFPAITHGKGKAVLKDVQPGVTDIDEFIRFVKQVAGEKGLGSFEDGSEGRGVVVVRYMPAKGGEYEWFAQFLTSFAQRLDHRPVDQREFLEAILACDASMLRRPLEEETQLRHAASHAPPPQDAENGMDVDQDLPQQQASKSSDGPEGQVSRPPRGRGRRAAVSRFKGFELDSDHEDETPAPVPVSVPERIHEAPASQMEAASQDSLFVSQRPDVLYQGEPPEEELQQPARRSRRKRALSPLPEHDDSAFLDGIAPTAAAAKRRRIQAGEDAVPPLPEPEPEPAIKEEESSPSLKGKRDTRGRGKKVGAGDDILELARQRREEGEARAAAERRELAQGDDDIDYAAIRALHIVEECSVRDSGHGSTGRTRDQDIADGRWDPRWNGRKNFKRFRKHGEVGGRPPPRVIVELEEVRPKEYGIGDDYWLENDSTSRHKENQRDTQSQAVQNDEARKNGGVGSGKDKTATRRTVAALDSSDEEDEEEDAAQEDATLPDRELEPEPEPSRSRKAKAAERNAARRAQLHSQPQSQSQGGRKRPAAAPPSRERAAKRSRGKQQSAQSEESGDDSDDDLKFRFGRRRA